MVKDNLIKIENNALDTTEERSRIEQCLALTAMIHELHVQWNEIGKHYKPSAEYIRE